MARENVRGTVIRTVATTARRILHFLFAMQRRALTVIVVLLLVVVLTKPDAEKYGDHLQYALPSLAWGCEIAEGRGKEYFLRFLVMEGILHGSKQGLGDIPLNTRPNGGDEGFPSGHTTAAVFGASALVQECLKNRPVVQMLVITAGGYVGASRIEAGKHDIWQVLAGVFLGWFCERFLRDDSPMRRRVIRALSRLNPFARRG